MGFPTPNLKRDLPPPDGVNAGDLGKDVKTNKTKTGETVPKTQELQMTKSTNEIAKLSICKRLRILRANFNKNEIPHILADNHTDNQEKNVEAYLRPYPCSTLSYIFGMFGYHLKLILIL